MKVTSRKPRLKHPGKDATPEELLEYYTAASMKVLTRKQIEAVFKETKTNREAADRLGVGVQVLYRFASIYRDENGVSLWESHKNRGGKDTSKGYLSDLDRRRAQEKGNRWKQGGKAKITFLHDLNNGVFERRSPNWIKRQLFALKIKEPKCDICGFEKQRVFDGRSPLVLLHKNGNRRDYTESNLELRCYNCCFLYGGPQPVKEEQVDQMESRFQDSKVLAPDWELDPYQKKFIDEMFKVGVNNVDQDIFEEKEEDGGEFRQDTEETSEMVGD